MCISPFLPVALLSPENLTAIDFQPFPSCPHTCLHQAGIWLSNARGSSGNNCWVGLTADSRRAGLQHTSTSHTGIPWEAQDGERVSAGSSTWIHAGGEGVAVPLVPTQRSTWSNGVHCQVLCRSSKTHVLFRSSQNSQAGWCPFSSSVQDVVC